jgi:hypothetical protein
MSDTRATDAGAQSVDTSRVYVDGTQVTPQSSEVMREGAVAGTDLEDRTVGGGGERREPLKGRPVSEEVLAEFMSATGMGSRSQDALQS